MRHCIICLAACLLLLAGCQRQPPAAPPAASAPETQTNHTYYLDHAQTGLPQVRLWVGPAELTAEVCLTIEQIATGMMYRTNLAENAGMLFAFGTPHQAAFYMKNTLVPLSAAYINPEGVILQIVDLQPRDERPVEANSDQVQYVLEVNQGWFARNNIPTGTVIRSSRGPLKDMFVRR